MELSNKTLSVLLILAIGLSLGGALLSTSQMGEWGITGFAVDNDTGKVNFTIQNQFSIRFVNTAIPFGTGFVNSSSGCQMGTNNSPPTGDPDGCNGFNSTVHTLNLTIENDGNIAANVSINFTANASAFINGTAPSFKYRVNQSAEPGSCTQVYNGTSFQEVGRNSSVGSNDTAVTGSRICRSLNYQDATDLIDIGFWMSIPQNVPSGDHVVTITAIGCDDSTC